jgi:hypothetical protein
MQYLLTIGFIAVSASAQFMGEQTHAFLKSSIDSTELFTYSMYCQHTIENYVFDFKGLQRAK